MIKFVPTLKKGLVLDSYAKRWTMQRGIAKCSGCGKRTVTSYFGCGADTHKYCFECVYHNLTFPLAGTQVLYVPGHLELTRNEYINPEHWGYPNEVQPGFLSSDLRDNLCYFVRYWNIESLYTRHPFLRTISNSELISLHDLVIWDTVEQKIVDEELERINNG